MNPDQLEEQLLYDELSAYLGIRYAVRFDSVRLMSMIGTPDSDDVPVDVVGIPAKYRPKWSLCEIMITDFWK